MNIDLIRKMVSSGVIRNNTEIEATYMGVDLTGRPLARVQGTFFIQGVKIMKSGLIQFDTLSTIDGSKRIILSDAVHSVDGMPLERLAGIYGIDEKGATIVQGKRRGRRPRAKAAAAA